MSVVWVDEIRSSSEVGVGEIAAIYKPRPVTLMVALLPSGTALVLRSQITVAPL